MIHDIFKDYAIHPLALLIPPMSAEDLARLTDDIAAHGLVEPIVLHEGQILDGRHRYHACQQAGVEPHFTVFDGDDPVAFVLSKNLHRRHLTSAQKAAIAVEALPLLEEQAKKRQQQAGQQFGRGHNAESLNAPAMDRPSSQLPQKIAEAMEARTQAATLTGTNRQYVSDAKKIAQDAPEVLTAMKAGTVTMAEAKTLAQQDPPTRKEILAALSDLTPEERREVMGAYQVPTLSVHHSSESAEWYTPSFLIDRVITALGAIDVDPCADPDKHVPAGHHFTAEDNGLAQTWSGTVFMNPPYGREIDAWVTKLLDEYAAGHVTQAIALVPARVDTEWFRRFQPFPVAFWHGRIAFLGPHGAVNPAPFPSALVGIGVSATDLEIVFGDVATVYVAVASEGR